MGMHGHTGSLGAIPTFIILVLRDLLASSTREQLKWVRAEQPVEVAFDLYPRAGLQWQGQELLTNKVS